MLSVNLLMHGFNQFIFLFLSSVLYPTIPYSGILCAFFPANVAVVFRSRLIARVGASGNLLVPFSSFFHLWQP
jgi:hypothetical protein